MNQNITKSNDEKYMQLALDLASKGNPSPNPYVGCIIVKEGRIIGQGFHKQCGMPHAEIEAIESINLDGKKLSEANRKMILAGSTFYITMEPCVHYGKTPPCVDKIIALKPKEVVIAILDPNPLVNGNGVKRLREAGIKVKVGVLEQEARAMNKTFIKFMKTGLPYVMMKAAVTLDWKLTWGDGKNKRITCEESNIFVHQLRNKVDAVLVGINTVLRDNPYLTTRLKGNIHNGIKTKDPMRVILDSELKIFLDANVLKDPNVVLITGSKAMKNKEMILKKKMLRKRGIKVFVTRDERIDIKRAIQILGKMCATSVLIEGGSRIFTSALNAELVDEIFFLVAPFVVGGKDSVDIFTPELHQMKFKKTSVSKIGRDVLIRAVAGYD